MKTIKPVTRLIILIFTFVVFCIYVVLCIVSFARPALGNESDIVASISGFAIYDSTYSDNGNPILTLFVTSSTNTFGNTVSSRGIVSAILPYSCLVTCGEEVKLWGSFAGDLFICTDDPSSIAVMSKPLLCHLRYAIIRFVEKRIGMYSKNQGSVLGSALILGRTEDVCLEIKEKARHCGCLHVFALSGMHLNVLSRFCRRLFGKKTTGKVISAFAVTLFVFIAGPRSSLVRALLMFYLSLFPSDERLCLAFLIQLILFPLTVINIGTLYGYLAVFALVFICPVFVQILSFFMPAGISEILGSSLCCIMVTAPVSIVNDGFWYPSAIFASPVCTVLISLSMAGAFASLITGNCSFVSAFNDFVCFLLNETLDFFARIPGAGWMGFAILMFIVAFSCATFAIARKRVRDLLSDKQVIK